MNALAVESTSSLLQHHTADGRAAVGASLRDLWRALLSGRYLVVETHVTPDSAALRLRQREVVPTRERDTAAFDRVVSGESQKVVAIESDLAPSSISAMLRRVMLGMDVNCPFSQLPLAIALLHHARNRPELATIASEPRAESEGSLDVVVCLRRCDWAISGKLSPIEFRVAQLLLEGHCYRYMAQVRKTSIRTIANQIASVYKKLGVGGRLALLRYAVDAASRSAESLAFRTAPDARRVLSTPPPSDATRIARLQTDVMRNPARPTHRARSRGRKAARTSGVRAVVSFVSAGGAGSVT